MTQGNLGQREREVGGSQGVVQARHLLPIGFMGGEQIAQRVAVVAVDQQPEQGVADVRILRRKAHGRFEILAGAFPGAALQMVLRRQLQEFGLLAHRTAL